MTHHPSDARGPGPAPQAIKMSTTVNLPLFLDMGAMKEWWLWSSPFFWKLWNSILSRQTHCWRGPRDKSVSVVSSPSSRSMRRPQRWGHRSLERWALHWLASTVATRWSSQKAEPVRVFWRLADDSTASRRNENVT